MDKGHDMRHHVHCRKDRRTGRRHCHSSHSHAVALRRWWFLLALLWMVWMPQATIAQTVLTSPPSSPFQSSLDIADGIGQCFVVIHLDTNRIYHTYAAPINVAINLAEVQLYDAQGKQIPRDTLSASLSSTFPWNPPLAASNCIDGDTAGMLPDICHSHSLYDPEYVGDNIDPNPSLTIGYPCPSGQTLGSLSRVMVFNRGDCCQERILYFMLDFQRMTSTGVKEVDKNVRPYWFVDAPSERSVNVVSDGAPVAYLNYTINVAVSTPGDGELRLVGGTAAAGRLQIFSAQRASWQDVCSTGFESKTAAVACRQLGLPHNNTALTTVFTDVIDVPPAYSGSGGTVDGFSCKGNETRLVQCSTTFPSTNNCSHDQAVALACIAPINRCFVTIHLVPGAAPTNLNLVEVELYDLHGIQIRDNLTALQSSMLNNYGGFACIDGIISDSIYGICHTQDYDPFPFLRIGYPCMGQTLGSLSRVVVYNRRDCCQFRTLSFMLDFQRLSKTALVEVDQDVMPYRFADAGMQLNYTINVTSVAHSPPPGPNLPPFKMGLMPTIKLSPGPPALPPLMSPPNSLVSSSGGGNGVRSGNNMGSSSSNDNAGPHVGTIVGGAVGAAAGAALLFGAVLVYVRRGGTRGWGAGDGGKVYKDMEAQDAGGSSDRDREAAGVTHWPNGVGSVNGGAGGQAQPVRTGDVDDSMGVEGIHTAALEIAIVGSEPAGVGGVEGVEAVAERCLRASEAVLGSTLRAVTSPAQCQQLAMGVAHLMPQLQAVRGLVAQHPAGSPSQECTRLVLQQLLDLLCTCQACIDSCAKRVAPDSQPDPAALMWSFEHALAFGELCKGLSWAADDLTTVRTLLASTPVPDAARWPPSRSYLRPVSSVEALAETRSVPDSGARPDTDSGVAPSEDMLPGDLECARQDMHAFIRQLVRSGGIKRWSVDSVKQLQRLCRSFSLDLEAMLQAEMDRLQKACESDSRAAAIESRVQSLFHIKWEDIQGPGGPGTALQSVGRGGHSVVFRGIWQGENVAVKRMNAAAGMLAFKDTLAFKEIVREAYIMSSCKHPNIAEIYGLAREAKSQAMCVVMRHYALGSLADVLRSDDPSISQRLTLAAKLQMALDIARGMAYLHTRPNEMVVHGDLKPGNVLVDEQLRCRITDFGMSSLKTDTRTIGPTSAAQTLIYSPPEVLERLTVPGQETRTVKRTADGDVFAYGMTLYELMTGQAPWSGVAPAHIVVLVTNSRRPDLLLPIHTSTAASGPVAAPPQCPEDGVPVPVALIIESCWHQDPFSRPAFSQVAMALEAAALALQVHVE